MRKVFKFSSEEVSPEREAILVNQGIPPNAILGEKSEQILNEAQKLFDKFAQPVGIIADISQREFAHIYEGVGKNESETPVGDLFPSASHMALFVTTVGEPLCQRIRELFSKNEFALASMLDAAASAGADKTADLLEERYLHHLLKSERAARSTAVMRYSPGYCGWDISGQGRLFEFLNPEEIGVHLNDSYLMQPLKSISGVMIAGTEEIHQFTPSYSFCSECRDQSCIFRQPTRFKD